MSHGRPCEEWEENTPGDQNAMTGLGGTYAPNAQGRPSLRGIRTRPGALESVPFSFLRYLITQGLIFFNNEENGEVNFWEALLWK